LSLLSASAVRERAQEMLMAGLADELPHFRIDIAQLEPTAEFVAAVIRESYPDLKVPLHSRWRHFVFGGHDFWGEIAGRTAWPDAAARARAEFDLAIISVLLDAGVSAKWRYHDPATGLTVGRSEGLALASLRMFEAGLFSADSGNPLRANAARLAVVTGGELARGFEAGADNPLTGLDGRAALLARFGRTMLESPQVFAKNDVARAGCLFDHLVGLAQRNALPAPALLHELLIHLAPIWPERLSLAGIALGDCWRHPAIKRADGTDKLVPLHKLSQWLSYSLIEPLQRVGITVTELDGLTGIAEYRNGGLFVDLGVLSLRDPAQAVRRHPIDSELVVEWRSLTVALLDRLATLVRDELGLNEQNFPLGSLLEGGTWAAGRKIARQKRADASSPLQIVSDGTVF
jgi:hypothetical protein